MESSTYFFHTKTKILADFQMCISLPLPLLTLTVTVRVKPGVYPYKQMSDNM